MTNAVQSTPGLGLIFYNLGVKTTLSISSGLITAYSERGSRIGTLRPRNTPLVVLYPIGYAARFRVEFADRITGSGLDFDHGSSPTRIEVPGSGWVRQIPAHEAIMKGLSCQTHFEIVGENRCTVFPLWQALGAAQLLAEHSDHSFKLWGEA
jgi:hypothetical protein